ncbi:hypothetical protein [Halomonas sp. WWR20]
MLKKPLVSAAVIATLVVTIPAIAEQGSAESRLRDPHQEKYHQNERERIGYFTVNDQQDNQYRRGYGNQNIISAPNADSQPRGEGDQGAEEANQGGSGGPYNSQGG